MHVHMAWWRVRCVRGCVCAAQRSVAPVAPREFAVDNEDTWIKETLNWTFHT